MSQPRSYPPIYKDPFHKATEHLRQTLPLINKHKTPITPDNYAVWYEYVAGHNHALKSSVDEILSKGEKITPNHTQDWYQKHVLMDLPDQIVSSNESLKTIVDQALSSVTRAEASAETCGAEIALTEHMLDDCQDMEQLRTIIASVAETTHQLSRTSQQLKDELHESNNEIMKLREELNLVKKAATTDSLTDLLNRGAFDQRLAECLLLNEREIAVLLFDIDHFKTVNDTHGHLLGDAVLQYFAKILKKFAANTHVAARFGGEEMAMILFDCDKNEANAIAEAILEKFSTSRLKKKNTNESIGRITASAGLTCLIEGDTNDTVLERADNALYRSKNNGRNQVNSA